MTTRVDPQLALALLVNEKWAVTLNGFATNLPAAVNTTMWGYVAAALKEVMIQTGHTDEPEVIIPHRSREGYGLNKLAVEKILKSSSSPGSTFRIFLIFPMASSITS